MSFYDSFVSLNGAEQNRIKGVLQDINSQYVPAMEEIKAVLQTDKPNYADQLWNPLERIDAIYHYGHAYHRKLGNYSPGSARELWRELNPDLVEFIMSELFTMVHILNKSQFCTFQGLDEENQRLANTYQKVSQALKNELRELVLGLPDDLTPGSLEGLCGTKVPSELVALEIGYNTNAITLQAHLEKTGQPLYRFRIPILR